MTTDYHTPITTGAAANAATFNAPLGELDAAIGSLSAAIIDNIATKSVALSSTALQSVTTGHDNTAIGLYSQYSLTTGNYNTAVGLSTLYSLTTGSYNTAVGMNALTPLTTGNYNTAVGMYAAKYIADGTTENTTSEKCVLIGAVTKVSADGVTNEVVIGYSATGSGSNTATYGNNSMTEHVFAAGALRLSEMSDPGAPAANKLRLYARDNGSGKTQLVVQFGSGSPTVLATEA